ncbi:nitroreductase family protein [Streptomyces sp. INA 01156]
MNWDDGPRKGKYYPDAEAFALPGTEDLADVPVAPGLLPGTARSGRRHLARVRPPAAVGDAPGLLRADRAPPRHPGQHRPARTAALHPRELVARHRGRRRALPGEHPLGVRPLRPPHSGSALLRHPPARPAAAAGRRRHGQGPGALGADAPAEALETDQYLLLGVKYWQNSFKYNSFSFHVVSTDVGTLVQTWRIWAAARGLRIAPALWFDEPRLTELLGTAGEEETVFAVVPLHWTGGAPPGRLPPPGRRRPPGVPHGPAPPAGRPAPGRRTLAHPAGLHRAERDAHGHPGGRRRPAPPALAAAAALPPPVPTPPAWLCPSRSSRTPASAAPCATAVPASAGSTPGVRSASGTCRRCSPPVPKPGRPATPIRPGRSGSPSCTPSSTTWRAWSRGVRVRPDRDELCPVVPGPQGSFLQENDFLANYNLEQAGAVLVPTVRTTAVLDALGDRGYRLAVGTAGAVAQSFYVAASALGLGAGVALGFDNVSFVERLGLVDGDEAPLLIMALGHERPQPADFRHEIA